MAMKLDCFGLEELTSTPEYMFHLAGLAMIEGRRIPGYGGEYYHLRIGDAAVVICTRLDPATGQEELLSMDTHARSDCLWSCQTVKDVTPEDGNPLARRVLVQKDGGKDSAVVDLLCADVLPDLQPGDTLHLNMVGFPLRISYDEGVSQGVVEAQQDSVLLQGVVKDARVGETFFGMEPLTKFVSVTVATNLGDVELCHPLSMVLESQQDLVRPGAVVSALCVLSGDCAVGEYAGGVVFDESHDLAVLSAFFRDGDPARLRPLLRSDCVCTFLENRQQSPENALALLTMVRQDMPAAGLNRCVAGVLTGEGMKGRKCLLLGGDEGFAFLCFLALDSLGRVKEITITNDPECDFDVVG